MSEQGEIEIIQNKNGSHTIILPAHLVEALYKASCVSSRKKRHVNKAVKRMFILAIREGLNVL